MSTPGRTHISWETEPAQIRELISYINFLEAKLSYLQYHHEHCDKGIARPPLPGANFPYLPPDVVDEGNVEASDEAGNKAGDGANNESRIPQATPSLTAASCICVSLTTTQPSEKRIESTPRWKRIVDQITKGWDGPSSWTEKREAIGLNSVEQNKYALTAILGLKKDLPLHLARDESQPSVSRDCVGGANNTLVISARQYALDFKASQINPGLVSQLHIFRELIFTSLCVVMEHQGLPIDTIDSLMRICISSSGAANLYRLRRGALWVNRVISGTMMKKLGWGHGSTEFFILSGRPVSQYGLLWEACVHSFPYLSNQLAQINRTVDIPPTNPDWIPFSIPLIIKQLVGDALTREQIYTALDYNIDL